MRFDARAMEPVFAHTALRHFAETGLVAAFTAAIATAKIMAVDVEQVGGRLGRLEGAAVARARGTAVTEEGALGVQVKDGRQVRPVAGVLARRAEADSGLGVGSAESTGVDILTHSAKAEGAGVTGEKGGSWSRGGLRKRADWGGFQASGSSTSHIEITRNRIRAG